MGAASLKDDKTRTFVLRGATVAYQEAANAKAPGLVVRAGNITKQAGDLGARERPG